MQKIETIFKIIFFVLVIIIIQNTISIRHFQKKITDLEISIKKLEYKEVELREKIRRLQVFGAADSCHTLEKIR